MFFLSKNSFVLVFALVGLITALLLDDANGQISRQECQDQGGTVVGDIGNGAIFQPDYRCAINNEPPSDVVIAQEGEPIASEGEVCCGGTGEGLDTTGGGLLEENLGGGGGGGDDLGFPGQNIVEREEMTRQECIDDFNGTIVGDIGNGAIFQDNYICESNGQEPIGNIDQTNEEAIAIEGEVCCGPSDMNVGVIVEDTAERAQMNRQQCTDQNGIVTGDIGNGAIHRPDYRCESNGEAPIATIIPLEGEPIAREGEVCCGPAKDTEVESMTINDDKSGAETDTAEDATSGEIAHLEQKKSLLGALLLALPFLCM